MKGEYYPYEICEVDGCDGRATVTLEIISRDGEDTSEVRHCGDHAERYLRDGMERD